MKNHICYFVNIFFVTISYSQLSGIVRDQDANPITFANVILQDGSNTNTEQGTLTDENGNFEIVVNTPGTYMLHIRLLGYDSWTSEPFVMTTTTNKKHFSDIRLSESTTTLDAVTLVNRKKLIEHIAEGSVINVQESVLTTGSSALQLLERSPGVVLDQRNSTFSLNGKSGSLVMINGKPIRMPESEIITLLNSMDATNIKKIELLTNPSARYDADGNAGIINIVLLKNEQLGTRGNYTVSTGYGEGPKLTNSFAINYGTKKTTAFGSYSFAYDDTFWQWSGVGNSEIEVLGGNTDIDFSSKTSQINRSHNATAGLDYQLTDTNLIGMNFVMSASHPMVTTTNRGLYDFVIDPFLEAKINLNARGRWYNYNTSLFYEIKKEKSTYHLTADLIRYSNKTPNTVSSRYFDENGQTVQPENDIYNTENRGFNETAILLGVLNTSYKKELNDELTIEGGLKASLSTTKNKARIEILRDGTFVSEDRFISNRTIDENIAAGYVLIDYNISKNWSINSGARYEYWQRNFDDPNLDRSFGKLFPSIFLKNTISEGKSLQLSYTKRITRPNFTDLASFLSYNGPTSVFSGNPELLPAISNTINLNYSYKSYNFSLQFSNENNPLARFQITSNAMSDLAVIAPVNLNYQNSLDFQTTIPIKFSGKWFMNINGTIGLREFQLLHTAEQLVHHYVHYNFNGSQTLQLPANISLEVSGWYTSNHFNGSTKNIGFGSLNAGIKKEFKNGSNLQVSITDLLKTSTVGFRVGTLTRERFGDRFEGSFLPESANSSIFRLSYSYPFGNKKVKKTNQRNSANEEKSRIGN